MFLNFEGIELNVNWVKGEGLDPNSLPTSPGVFVEVYWRPKPDEGIGETGKPGVRIGQAGKSIRANIRHDIRWFEGMKNRTEKQEQLRRTLPIAMAAKATGKDGFEFYVASDNPRLENKNLRQRCKSRLFDFIRKEQEEFED